MPSKEEQTATLTKVLTDALTAGGLKWTAGPARGAIQDVEVTNTHGHV
jgi:hypothetical protein